LSLGGCGGSGGSITAGGNDGGGNSGGNGGGGGGGGVSITGLAVAEKVSVVEAKPGQGTSKLAALLFGGVTFDSTTEYMKDPSFTYVNDRSTEAFGTVNEILCMVAQTKYDVMVNKGPYQAMINSKLCRGNDSANNASTSQQGGTSGGEAPEYETWTVDSTRASSTADQIVNVWVHEKARSEGNHSEPEKVIKAQMIVKKSATEVPPYGLFTINFAGYPASNGVPQGATPMLKGVLKSEQDPATGKVTLKFIDQEPGNNGKAVALQKNADGSGSGAASMTEYFNNTTQPVSIKFAYDASLFHRQNADGSKEVCLDRVHPETSAWRYGMYDTNGARVNLASGFPINTKIDGKGQHGWVGFWGMSLPDGTTITDNTVYKMNYGQNTTPTPYSVVQVGGKLKKHKKFMTTLGNITNIPLEGYSEPDPQNTSQMLNFRVKWDGTKLMKIAYSVQTQNQSGPPAWNDLSTPVAINTSALQWGELNFWSQALGGQVRVKLSGCSFNQQTGKTACTTPDADTPVAYYVENIVYPGDAVPAGLACYDNCPAVSAGVVTGSQMGGGQQQTVFNYSFANSVLKDAQNNPLLQTAQGGQSWGFNSGPIFDASLIANPATSSLKCDWNDPQGNPQICGWKAWSVLDEFYTWETGSNNWNKLTVLKDSQGNALKFEQPLKVEYTHNQAPYNGTKFYLDYNGFGELQGIPGKCVNMEDGTAIDCSQGSSKPVRWVPEITIPKDSQVKYTKFDKTTGQSTSYDGWVKPLEMEQRMTKVAVGSCATLPVPANFTLPTISEWSDPTIGDEPSVTSAPAVIAGEVK
jgi:hypothetical protein